MRFTSFLFALKENSAIEHTKITDYHTKHNDRNINFLFAYLPIPGLLVRRVDVERDYSVQY